METELLTKEEILNFQKLCKEVKGIVLTYQEAEEQAIRLLQTFDILLDKEMVVEKNYKK